MRDATREYALVHLVVQEAEKELIGPQVMDHAASQAASPAADAPAVVVVAFLEPARRALDSVLRGRVRAHARRAPGVRTLLAPFVGRLGRRNSARLVARRLQALTRGLPVVFHCRGEAAVEWAIALEPHFPLSAIIADIRGAWPEELLFARGFDSIDQADEDARVAHGKAMDVIRMTTTAASHVLSVSAGMLDWLREVGVPDAKLTYVPCCVSGVSFTAEARERIRSQLGVADRLVLCYSGTITRYQHVEDGVLPFFRHAAERHPDLHLLCLTPDRERMLGLLEASGIDAARATVLRLAQHEVHEYLSAADAGLLLRAPSRLNQFSQPTKFGEYLSAGLPVIVSEGTGDLPRIVRDAEAGTVVRFFGMDPAAQADEAAAACEQLRTHREAWRANAIALCRRDFQWTSYTSAVRDAYRTSLDVVTDIPRSLEISR